MVKARQVAAILVLSLSIGAAEADILNYSAILDGAQSGTASPATGSGTFVIDTDLNSMTYDIIFSGLLGTETVAHIHGFAPPAVSAGILHTLPAGSPKQGVWNYAEAQEPDILAGLTYVNVHSTVSPGGEIRGQIVPEPAAVGLILLGGMTLLRRRTRPV